MRYRIFIEKKNEYAYAARRLFHHLTDQCGMHTVNDVRILRCLIIDTAQAGSAIPTEMLYDPATETYVQEDAVRPLVNRDDNVFCCVIPLFRRPAEQLTEHALRMMLSKNRTTDDIAPDGEQLYFRQADVFVIGGIRDDKDRARVKKLLVNPASAAELPLFTTETLPPQFQYADDDWMPIREFRSMDAEVL